MMQFPPIPSWDAMHPLIVHFPVVLLLIAPLFVVIGALVRPEKGRLFLICALILMVLGTASTYVAVGTGEAAGKVAERMPGAKAVLEQHENLAETTRLAFSVLTAIFLAILLIPRVWPKVNPRLLSRVLPLIFLGFYSAGILLLINTAHHGGRLVHEFGVHAVVAPSARPAADAPNLPLPAEHHEERD